MQALFSLGDQPLANGFLGAADLAATERRYPLDLDFCSGCALVQLRATVAPEILFPADFPYRSSYSATLVDDARRNAGRLIETRGLDAGSLVVEPGSNDGYMLRHFAAAGVPVLGIDPADEVAEAARCGGVPTLCARFGRDLAAALVAEGKRADLLLANNVLAHVPDPNDFVAGIGLLLKDDGVAVIEVGYVRDLVDGSAFDTIYHEHQCYFSLTSLVALFGRHDLFVNGVVTVAAQGGSLRLFVARRESPDGSLAAMLTAEAKAGLGAPGFYRALGSRARERAQAAREHLAELKARGKTIAGYGAAAKGTVFLNYAGIGGETLEYVVDRNPAKHGRFIPGARVAIGATDRLLEDRPDYVLLLVWNLRDEVLRQEDEYRRRGGRFVIAIPKLEIV